MWKSGPKPVNTSSVLQRATRISGKGHPRNDKFLEMPSGAYGLGFAVLFLSR